MQAKGRLQCWKLPRRAGCNPGAAKADGQGRLQPWSSRGCEGWQTAGQAWWKLPAARKVLVEAAAEVFRGLGFEGWQTAGSNAVTREGYVQAKGRLQ